MRFTAIGIVVALISLLPLGCASYVNIPPQTGDIALHDPNLATVAQIEAKAIRGMLTEDQIGRPFQISLPERTSSAQYSKVTMRLGEHAFAADENPQSSLPQLSVRQVRVRGWYAQVDVIRPTSFRQPDGPQQLATVWLRWYPFAGWQYQRMHLWSIGVIEALSESRRLAEVSNQP